VSYLRIRQIDGWTEPSVQDLRQLIVQHGGIFHAYLDRKALVYAPCYPSKSQDISSDN
jgi:hypothetical protein